MLWWRSWRKELWLVLFCRSCPLDPLVPIPHPRQTFPISCTPCRTCVRRASISLPTVPWLSEHGLLPLGIGIVVLVLVLVPVLWRWLFSNVWTARGEQTLLVVSSSRKRRRWSLSCHAPPALPLGLLWCCFFCSTFWMLWTLWMLWTWWAIAFLFFSCPSPICRVTSTSLAFPLRFAVFCIGLGPFSGWRRTSFWVLTSVRGWCNRNCLTLLVWWWCVL